MNEPTQAPGYDAVRHERTIRDAIKRAFGALVANAVAVHTCTIDGNWRRARNNQLLAEMEAITMLDWIDSLEWQQRLVEWHRQNGDDCVDAR
jgi:hypothetical protein